MVRTMCSTTEWVRFDSESLRQVLRLADRWLDENDVFVENVVVTQEQCVGQWYLYIYYRGELE